MLQNKNNLDCGFADEIVSYIYDELTSQERGKFESHLTSCAVCTDEFATISNARFSVFEWQKEEFSKLSTPEFVIPYESSDETAVQGAASGFWAGIRDLWAVSNWPLTAVAGIVVMIGLGFIAITVLNRGGNEISANITVETPDTAVTPAPFTRKAVETQPEPQVPESRNDFRAESSPGTSLPDESQTSKSITVRKPKPDRQVTAGTLRPKNQSPAEQSTKTPVLNTYDELDDRSLRLADLFDDEMEQNVSL
ncbi:MAG: hypothetical protein ABIV48_10975 [Pyrinomonadaceae bacterium]